MADIRQTHRNAGAGAHEGHGLRLIPKDEARTREEWGRFGNIAVALTPERQSTRAWSTGALGEEQVGARLDGIASERIQVLHDRRILGSKRNIDHIVVTPAGVWVVDTKRYKGVPSLRVEAGLFRPRVERLFVGGRDQTRLVDGVLGKIQEVLAVVPDAPVRCASWMRTGHCLRLRSKWAVSRCCGLGSSWSDSRLPALITWMSMRSRPGSLPAFAPPDYGKTRCISVTSVERRHSENEGDSSSKSRIKERVTQLSVG